VTGEPAGPVQQRGSRWPRPSTSPGSAPPCTSWRPQPRRCSPSRRPRWPAPPP